MEAARAAEHHRDQWGLMWYLQLGICTSIPNWNHSQNSLAAAKHLSNYHEDNASQPDNSHKLCDKSGHLILSLLESQTEITTWSEFRNGGKAIVEKIIALEERNKNKKAGLWESQSGIRVGKLTIGVRSFEI